MRIGLVVGLSGLLCALPVAAQPDEKIGQLLFKRCDLIAPSMPEPVSAQCAVLSVPQDPAAQQGKQIDIHVARIRAQKKNGHRVPWVLIAGGPGQSASESFPPVLAAFEKLRIDRDIYLIDQRGTGKSNPLHCETPENAASTDEADMAVAARRCLDQFDVDPKFFTTTNALNDFEAVRIALGAEAFHVLGVSYGTRVAQQFARRFPNSVRSLVLDGVVPNALMLPSEFGANLDDAIDAMIARCSADSECAARYGDLHETLDKLIADYTNVPRDVEVVHPLTGERVSRRLDRDTLLGLVRLYSYSPLTTALLPITLSEAADGRPESLVAQSYNLAGDLNESMAAGMQLSVICSEDIDFVGDEPTEKEKSSRIGPALLRAAKAQCSVWPRGERPENFHAPLQSNVPTILLSGQFDPVTPARYGDEVLAGLPNGRHFVLKGQGHFVSATGCVPRLLAEFALDLKPAALDADCLDNLSAEPFFLSLTGGAP